ncbi:MAG: Npun_F5749 family FMN-dependent PPOX-type flavoprotein [Cyanobacteria bacterium P01_A01_bin.135]
MPAPWRSPLSRALHRNRSTPNARYFQLATVRPDGSPANRTVVFRSFREGTDQVQIVCDRRSAKPAQIEHCQRGEICWYFPKTREQFRLTGGLQLITSDEPSDELQQARTQAWQAQSDAGRLLFAWPHPAQPRKPDVAFNEEPPDAAVPLANFCLLLLQPQWVDHLELRGEPQNRWRYTQNETDGRWSVVEVNP